MQPKCWIEQSSRSNKHFHQNSLNKNIFQESETYSKQLQGNDFFNGKMCIENHKYYYSYRSGFVYKPTDKDNHNNNYKLSELNIISFHSHKCRPRQKKGEIAAGYLRAKY